ncbi:hypothetical protein [Umezawaea tangerina]|uniref:hypothetical protein n=1 Tax=Umezawaea tangerina TaxID=84725 RepID=UPI000D085C4E|nr:hypothetical protein [Umezawaea tangerina]
MSERALILMVTTIRELSERTLRFAGFDVAAAGPACPDADLVLLDVMQSHRDRFELARQLGKSGHRPSRSRWQPGRWVSRLFTGHHRFGRPDAPGQHPIGLNQSDRVTAIRHRRIAMR